MASSLANSDEWKWSMFRAAKKTRQLSAQGPSEGGIGRYVTIAQCHSCAAIHAKTESESEDDSDLPSQDAAMPHRTMRIIHNHCRYSPQVPPRNQEKGIQFFSVVKTDSNRFHAFANGLR